MKRGKGQENRGDSSFVSQMPGSEKRGSATCFKLSFVKPFAIFHMQGEEKVASPLS
jgi:hypothetical protein